MLGGRLESNIKYILSLILSVAFISIGCSKEEALTNSNLNKETNQNEETQWPRVYIDGLGRQVNIEKQPKKIVALHFGYTEYLMSLDIPPIGVGTLSKAKQFKTLSQYESMNSFIDVGDTVSPNLEKILDIKPDLIIATPGIHDNALESLEKISTVVYKTNYGTWQETLNDYGKMLGKEDIATKYIEDIKNIIAETRKNLSEYNDKTFVFLRPSSKDSFWTPGSNEVASFYHDIDDGFGMNTPIGYPKEAGNISLEALLEMNPDYIFFQDDEDLCRQTVLDLEISNVWKSISAVEQNNIGYLDISLNTGSPLAIRLASEQIIDFLGKGSGWPRTYVDTLGREVLLQARPENIALIFFRNYEHLITLDEIPFAATDVQDVYKGWASLAPFAEKHEIIDLGTIQTPNIEKLLDSSPDLIIVYSGTYEKVGEQLEKIAPTITVNNYGDDWQTPIREYGVNEILRAIGE